MQKSIFLAALAACLAVTPAFAQGGAMRTPFAIDLLDVASGAKRKAANVAGATVIPAGAGAMMSYYRGKRGPGLQRTRIVCDDDGEVNIGPTEQSRFGGPNVTTLGPTVVLMGGGGQSCAGAQ